MKWHTLNIEENKIGSTDFIFKPNPSLSRKTFRQAVMKYKDMWDIVLMSPSHGIQREWVSDNQKNLEIFVKTVGTMGPGPTSNMISTWEKFKLYHQTHDLKPDQTEYSLVPSFEL